MTDEILIDSTDKTVGFTQRDRRVHVVSTCCGYFLEERGDFKIAVCSLCGRNFKMPTDPRDSLIWEPVFLVDETSWAKGGMDMNEQFRSFVAGWLGVELEEVEVSIDG